MTQRISRMAALLLGLMALAARAELPRVRFVLRFDERSEWIAPTRSAPSTVARLLGPGRGRSAVRVFRTLAGDEFGASMAYTLTAGGVARTNPRWSFEFSVDADDDSGRLPRVEIDREQEVSRVLFPARSVPAAQLAETLLRMAARMADPGECDDPQELSDDPREVLSPRIAFRAGFEDYLVARFHPGGARSRAVLAAAGPESLVLDHPVLGRREVPLAELDRTERLSNEIVVARILVRLERELSPGFLGIQSAFVESARVGCRTLQDLLHAYLDLYPRLRDDVEDILREELDSSGVPAS